MFFSPCGKKFRSKPQIARFLGESADLTCFDFSRAGSLGDGTRRRARDRNPQGSTKKFDPNHMMSPPVRPLSANPLRATGPVRRTCGVIKLPVMLLSPPAGNTELRDSIIGQQGGADIKGHTLNVVVQSLWERRLNTICPQDYATGKDISRLDIQSVPAGYSTIARDPLSTSTPPLHPQQPVLPSLLGTMSSVPSNNTSPHNTSTLLSSSPLVSNNNSYSTNKYPTHSNASTVPPNNSGASAANHKSVLTGTKLLQLHQQQQQLAAKLSSSSSHVAHRPSLPPPPSSSLSLTITDSDVKLQEKRVQLLRQQLMAAQGSL